MQEQHKNDQQRRGQQKDKGYDRAEIYLGYRDNRLEFGPNGAATKRLAGQITHSERSADVAEIEKILISNTPYPFDIKFDMFCNQEPYFDSFGYTEFCRGLQLMTQSVEINHRMTLAAVTEEQHDTAVLDTYRKNLQDKYKLTVNGDMPSFKGVIFLPGTNRLQVAHLGKVAEILDTHPEVMVKPHPLTNIDTFRTLRRELSHTRLLDPKASGFELLLKAETVYTTSSSETGFQAWLLGKHVVNATDYVYESSGTYSHLNYHLFRAQEQGQAAIDQTLANLICSPYGGIMDYDNLKFNRLNIDMAERVRMYTGKAIELREHWKPMVRKARF